MSKKDIANAIAERVQKVLKINYDVAPGFEGGFEESNPEFPYPKHNLTSETIQGNLDNMDSLQRQMRILWPEFTWQTIVGEEKSRCFRMFAPNISRLGYTNEGQVLSVICPQMGTYTKRFGCINTEVTVTGNRGWVNENNSNDTRLAGQVSVTIKIWFSSSPTEFTLLKELEQLANKKFEGLNHQLPFTKEHAICIETHCVNEPTNPYLYFLGGLSDLFEAPEWTQHPEAYQRANISVQIGKLITVGNEEIDHFNQLILNLAIVNSGNMLKDGNILSWNMWTDAPEVVDVEEWKDHAEKWRKSLDTDHGSPDGPESKIRYRDASLFSPLDTVGEDFNKAIHDLEELFEHKFDEVEGRVKNNCCSIN